MKNKNLNLFSLFFIGFVLESEVYGYKAPSNDFDDFPDPFCPVTYHDYYYLCKRYTQSWRFYVKKIEPISGSIKKYTFDVKRYLFFIRISKYSLTKIWDVSKPTIFEIKRNVFMGFYHPDYIRN